MPDLTNAAREVVDAEVGSREEDQIGPLPRCAAATAGPSFPESVWLIDSVGTSHVPAADIAATAASSRKTPCSTLRAPACAASSAAGAPWACTMTPARPCRRASDTSAAISSGVIWLCCARAPCRIEPVAVTLIQSAPARVMRRTTARAARRAHLPEADQHLRTVDPAQFDGPLEPGVGTPRVADRRHAQPEQRRQDGTADSTRVERAVSKKSSLTKSWAARCVWQSMNPGTRR